MSAIEEVQKDVRLIEQNIGGPDGINVRLKALETDSDSIKGDVEEIKKGLKTLIDRPVPSPASFAAVLTDPQAFAKVVALVAAIGSAVAGSGWYAGRATAATPAAPQAVHHAIVVPVVPAAPETPVPGTPETPAPVPPTP